MTHGVRRLLAALVGGLALLVLTPLAASAHPLGNFTVNRYSGLVVAHDAVTLEHVLDLAEIPTAQRSPAIDTDRDGALSRPELAAWAATQCASSTGRLVATVAGQPLHWAVTGAAASTTPGQADLPILRLDCRLRAAAAIDTATTLRFRDTGAGDQVGWREVTARGDGVTLTRSDVPTRSTSARLTAYPKDLLTSPLDVRGARLQVRPGGARLPSGADPVGGVATVAGGVTGSFQGLATRYDGSPLVAVTALVAALALGAGHAVAPGHGKTIMAFYLSGRREGALRAAGTVGVTVTATHTAGVLLLGLLVGAGTSFVPARVYPWLTVLSGVLVATVGLTLLRSARRGGHVHGPGGHTHGAGGHARELGGHPHAGRGRAARPALRSPDGAPAAGQEPAGAVSVLVADEHGHDHPHPHEGSLDDEHPHDHSHDHQHRAHDHLHPHPQHHVHPHDRSSDDEQPQHPAGPDAHRPEPPSRRGLVAMGLAGGLLPSPSAVLVFLGALAVGHPWFGVLLVVAFGLGMATTLAAVGVLVMRLRQRVERRLHRGAAGRFSTALRVLPVLTALTVTTLGAVLALRGLGSLGA